MNPLMKAIRAILDYLNPSRKFIRNLYALEKKNTAVHCDIIDVYLTEENMDEYDKSVKLLLLNDELGEIDKARNHIKELIHTH